MIIWLDKLITNSIQLFATRAEYTPNKEFF